MRRTWLQRLLLVAIALVALVASMIGAIFAYTTLRLGQIQRTTVAKGTLKAPDKGLPFNILLVGSDSRADLTGKDTSSFGDPTQVKGQRSDTMMLVHIDPRTGGVGVLSIPRDLWVPIADVGAEDKINQAFDGGPTRLVKTIKAALGVEVNHYAQVDFVGFRGVVNALRGVTVWIPNPARDPITGLDLPSAGCVALNGDQALAYVRSRSYGELKNGRWRIDPTADFGRIKRQQGFLRYTMRRAKTNGGLTNVDALVRSVLKTVTIDDQFSRSEITTLARRFRGLSPETIRTYVLPTTPDVVEKKDILRLDQTKAADVINRFNGFLGNELRPEKVTLSVTDARAPGARPLATAATARLGDLGFRVARTAAPASGDGQTGRLVRTEVRHRPDTLDKAQYVASYLIGAVDLVEDPTLPAQVEIRIGASYAGIRDVPRTPPTEALDANDVASAHPCDGQSTRVTDSPPV